MHTRPVAVAAANVRDVITPESFAIAPELLGLPLARPWRRAAAMLADLALVAILVQAGGVFFGATAAFTLFSASSRRAGGGVLKRMTRFALRFAAALALFITVLSVWGFWEEDEPDTGGGFGDVIAMGAEFMTLSNATDSADARTAAASLIGRLATSDPEAVAGLRAEFEEDSFPGVNDVGEWALRTELAIAAERADSLAALAVAEAVDSPATRSDTAVLALEQRNLALEQELEETRAELSEARDRRGFVTRFLSGLANDLGLGFGWSGLYFTAFTVLLGGQTPGKRLLRIRIVQLDGKRIGWWGAFGRFGGYSASLATGLLGFFQVLWDRNRQTLEDKLADTVVISLPKKA